jgi:hypothetical protein
MMPVTKRKRSSDEFTTVPIVANTEKVRRNRLVDGKRCEAVVEATNADPVNVATLESGIYARRHQFRQAAGRC